MMTSLVEIVARGAPTLIGVTFLALYLLHLGAGVEPELALARAGGAGLLLALLGRILIVVLDPGSRTPRFESRPPDQSGIRGTGLASADPGLARE